VTGAGAYYFCGDLSTGHLGIIILVATGMAHESTLGWGERAPTTVPQVRFCLESGRFSQRRSAAAMFCWSGMGY